MALTPLEAFRAGSKLWGKRTRISGRARLRPVEGGLLITFEHPGRRDYVRCRVDLGDAGDLKEGVRNGDRCTVTVEGEGVSGSTWTLSLGNATVVAASWTD